MIILLYFVVAAAILCLQFAIMLEAGRHFNYLRRKWPPIKPAWTPKIRLIVPCKGIDQAFEKNIFALFQQDYADYSISFVLDNDADPAYHPLETLIRQQQQAGNPVQARMLLAGAAKTCSGKVHKLLTACRQLPADIEALVFADSDACPPPHFLGAMVHPLRRPEVGASTGYRWYVPTDFRLSSLTLSAMNAFFASLLGPHQRNCAWGGAMAFTREFYRRAELEKRWETALSDDYIVSLAAKELRQEIYFVPACFIASYEQTSWPELLSFARRQFIITRIYMPSLWRFGVLAFIQYLAAFWGGLAVTWWLWQQGNTLWRWAIILPATVYVFSILKALIRQGMILRILRSEAPRLIIPALLDLFFQPVFGWITLACILSATGANTITWRGIRYKINTINHIEIIP